LLHETQKPADEEIAYRRAETLLSEVVAADPSNLEWQAKLITVRTNFAEFFEEQQKLAMAESVLRSALAQAEKAATLNSDQFEAQTKIALVLTGLGRVLDKRGQDHAAEDCYRRSAELRKNMVENYPSIPHFVSELARNLNLLAKLIARQPGREQEAVQAASAAVQYQRTANKLSPNVPYLRRQLFELLSDFAEFLLKTGDHPQAGSVAMELSTLAVRDKRGSYTGAAILAKCLALVKKDPGLSPAQRTVLVEKYANLAIRLLAEALKKGEIDAAKLQQDDAFASLAGRRAFQDLIGVAVKSSGTHPR
jgi:tetratricopeptide (TPR) repeat protein